VAQNGISLFGKDGVVVPVPSSVTASLPDGKEVIVGLRPEAITDDGLVDPAARSIAHVAAEVTMVEPTGSDTFVTGKLDGASFTARTRAEVMAEPGQTFRFAFNLDKAVVFDPGTGIRID
jgi:multiple sugar transport system ATP-binding protein